MQTFLPISDFRRSLQCLDWKRLGKQRVEAKQILNCLSGSSSSWKNHPTVRMWLGYENALRLYMNTAIELWISRGYNNTMQLAIVSTPVIYPWWFGVESFHASHRSNLLRKNFQHYSQFGWTESEDLPYWWPTKEMYHGKTRTT